MTDVSRGESRPGRLTGQVAIVTGGAQGQGEAEARLFHAEGAFVVVADVLDEAGTTVAAELAAGAPGTARFAHLDVTRLEDWERLVTSVMAEQGRLDILVNNAGIGFPPVAFDASSLDAHYRVIDVNLHGVYLGMRAAHPAMVTTGGGSIVNISSIDGIVGVMGMTSYTASKFAVTGMTKCAAIEFGPEHIRVNSIHPGVIESPMVKTAPAEVRARLDRMMARQPIRRMGTPEEVAKLALFLASDDSSYCTGAEFVVDGGHIAGPYREGF
jgi:3alpha(or 20beta)-hydroxysteroid dehydrogenase